MAGTCLASVFSASCPWYPFLTLLVRVCPQMLFSSYQTLRHSTCPLTSSQSLNCSVSIAFTLLYIFHLRLLVFPSCRNIPADLKLPFNCVLLSRWYLLNRSCCLNHSTKMLENIIQYYDQIAEHNCWATPVMKIISKMFRIDILPLLGM